MMDDLEDELVDIDSDDEIAEAGGSDEQMEDDNEDEGEQAEDDEEEYALRFEGNMDPLAFTEVDQNGNLPYQQFERLESETLANRKRKRSDEDDEEDTIFGASVDEIWEAFEPRRRHKGEKRETRRKRTRRSTIAGVARLPADVSAKLGEANLFYATERFDEAIPLLKEVVRQVPNTPDAYHTLGLVYDAMGDRSKALNFYMICAHLRPRDAALWKRLAYWSIEMQNTGQAIHCLTKALRADRRDVDIDDCMLLAKMHHETGNNQRAIQVLEKFIEDHSEAADITVLEFLVDLHMANASYAEAVSHIDRARVTYCAAQGLSLYLAVKAGICHLYLGNVEASLTYFEVLPQEEIVGETADLFMEVGDAFVSIGQHQNGLGYYLMLVGNDAYDNGTLSLKIAGCYLAIDSIEDAIKAYYNVIEKMPQHVDPRLTLATLLLTCGRQDEACAILKPPQLSVSESSQDGRVRMMLANIYHSQEKLDLFLETILPTIQESLVIESFNQKVKGKNKLSKSVLEERAKSLECNQEDEVFQGFGPILPRNERAKALRAKRLLAARAAERKQRKAAALVEGLDWDSEDELDDPEVEKELKKTPLPNLLKDEAHYLTLLEACKALASFERYWEAMEVINQYLMVGSNLSKEKQNELRALGAEIASKKKDVKYGFEHARYMVQQNPYSLSAWNRYYQVVTRSDQKLPNHHKFMLQMRAKYPDCVPAMIICGHQFGMISQTQNSLREYLQAYKQQPEDPFINLCVGVSFINLSQAFRIHNRNQCVIQGFAFLHKYQRLSNHSQESNYNMARAYHCVGLAHLAVPYYEKVLEDSNGDDRLSLRREAAHNLHLIYKESGAIDLARQVLWDYCSC